MPLPSMATFVDCALTLKFGDDPVDSNGGLVYEVVANSVGLELVDRLTRIETHAVEVHLALELWVDAAQAP